MADSSAQKFIQEQNIKIFKKRLKAASDEAQRRMLLTLLAEEEAKVARIENMTQPIRSSGDRIADSDP